MSATGAGTGAGAVAAAEPRDAGSTGGRPPATDLTPIDPPAWLQAVIDDPDPAAAATRMWAGVVHAPVIGPMRSTGGRGVHEVTFLWRDPRPTLDVLVHINGVTDARRDDLAHALLERIPGTDIWHRTYLLPADGTWGYRFVAEEVLPGGGSSREGWMAVHRAGRVDPLNKRRQPHAHGSHSSVLVMPGAYQHPAWEGAGTVDSVGSEASGPAPDGGPSAETWILAEADGRERRVRRAVVGSGRRTLVLLDGEMWQSLGVLDALAAAGVDVEVLIVESGSMERRGEDMPRPERAAGVVDAVLRRRADEVGGPREATDVVVAGQSYTGLAAAAAVLLRPDLAREAIVQSGSFWYAEGGEMRRDNPEPGDLVQRVRSGELRADGLRFRLQAGTDEGAMVELAAHFHDAARAAGADVSLEIVAGGHDYAWWKHHLLKALTTD
ncbi:MAG: enterochelin esterase domain-containing protein [Actinomycetaceae bacterium]